MSNDIQIYEKTLHKKATAKAVSAHDGNCDYECECDCGCDCEYECGCGCDARSFIDNFIHWLPCLENFTSEDCTL